MLLMCPDVSEVGQGALWRGELVIRPGRVVMAHLLSVWFPRGMENRSHHIIGPKLGQGEKKREKKNFLTLLCGDHCGRGQREGLGNAAVWR